MKKKIELEREVKSSGDRTRGNEMKQKLIGKRDCQIGSKNAISKKWEWQGKH